MERRGRFGKPKRNRYKPGWKCKNTPKKEYSIVMYDTGFGQKKIKKWKTRKDRGKK